MSRPAFTREEEDVIRKEWRRAREATCPRCDEILQDSPVDPPAAVAYVRSRNWLRCPGCGRVVVVDGARDL